MSQLDELRRRYQELGEEIAKLEKQPKVPPKGWPVQYFDCNDGRLVRSVFGEHMEGCKCLYYTLPDGRELSPENFGKGGHKVEMCKAWNRYGLRIDEGMYSELISEVFARKLAGDKFDTIGNEWVEV